MIRAVLGLFAFAVALCAYIVVSPGDRPTQIQPIAAATDVTRAATQSLLPGAPLDVEDQGDRLAAAPAPAPVTVPETQVQTDDSNISSTAINVLAGLGLTIDPETADPAMADLSSDVLQDIGAVTGDAPTLSQPSPTTALENLVVAALREGRPDAEIDSLVNAAATAGQLTVPEILVTSDGRVDTAILLQSIINEANIAAGGSRPAVPDVPAGDGTGVEVRVVQRAAEAEQYRFYTVNRGDSLGAIAIKFYGDVTRFQVIYEANRAILSSPDQIRVGQRLAIPELPQT